MPTPSMPRSCATSSATTLKTFADDDSREPASPRVAERPVPRPSARAPVFAPLGVCDRAGDQLGEVRQALLGALGERFGPLDEATIAPQTSGHDDRDPDGGANALLGHSRRSRPRGPCSRRSAPPAGIEHHPNDVRAVERPAGPDGEDLTGVGVAGALAGRLLVLVANDADDRHVEDPGHLLGDRCEQLGRAARHARAPSRSRGAQPAPRPSGRARPSASRAGAPRPHRR